MKLSNVCLLTLLCTLPFASLAGVVHYHDKDGTKHQTYQKPGAPIRIASPTSVALDPYSRHDVVVSFDTPSAGTLSIEAMPKEGIALESGSTVQKNLATEEANISLSLSSFETGRYYVMFHTQYTAEDGTASSRVLGVPVIVGNPQVNTFKKTHPEVIVLPAQETIRQQ